MQGYKDQKKLQSFAKEVNQSKKQSVFIQSTQQQIENIVKTLINVESSIQYLRINCQVINSQKLKQQLNNLPNLKDIAIRTQELFNYSYLKNVDLKWNSDAVTELKKNKNYVDTDISDINCTNDSKYKNGLSQYFRYSSLEIQNVSSDQKDYSSIDQFQSPFKKYEIDLQKYKIQSDKNHYLIQQFPMKMKPQNEYRGKQQKNSSNLFQILKTKSQIHSYNNSIQSQQEPTGLSSKGSQNQLDCISNRYQYDDDPLINMKKYKIQNFQNKQEWDKADNTLTNIKQILCNFSHDQKQNQQQKNKSQFFQKIKVKNKIENKEIIQNKNIQQNNEQIIQKQIQIQSKNSSDSQLQFDTTEQRSSKRSYPLIYQVPLSINHYTPECVVCPQVFNITIQNNYDSQDYGDLMQSKKTQEQNFGYSKSMIQNMSLKIGAPVYLLNDASSQGNRTDRQMYIQQKSNLVFNQNNNILREIQDPLVSVSQYYDMRQKVLHVEQEKNEIFDQLRGADKQIKTLRQQLCVNKQKIDQLMHENQDNKQKIINILAFYSKKQQQLQNQLKQSEQCRVKLQQVNQALKQQRNYLSKVLKDQQYEIVSYKSNINELKNNFEVQMQKVTSENIQKSGLIRQLQKQLYDNKVELKSQMYELTKVNDELRTQIQQCNKDIDGKRVQIQYLRGQIQKLNNNHSQIMSTLQKTCNQDEQFFDVQQLSTFHKVYSQQFSKLKQDYKLQILQKKDSIDDLETQNKKLKQSINYHKQKQLFNMKKYKQFQQIITKLQQKINSYQQQNKKGKLFISSQVQQQINYLRKQLVTTHQQLQIKDIQIKELLIQIKKIKVQQPNISVQFVASSHQQTSYILQLKQIIQDYQNVIQYHHQFIKDLQQSSYQFLQDALEKQKQIQKLNQKIRFVILQRSVLYKQNTRLKKMVTNSQKRISAIGRMMNLKPSTEKSYTITKISEIPETVPQKSDKNID